MGGPNMDPQLVGSYYKDYQKGAPNSWKHPYRSSYGTDFDHSETASPASS